MRRGASRSSAPGPGDAELLTLKAVRALQAADVILFDDLVSEDVLELARREAKRMMVGKRARGPSCSQSDINALMLKLARQGKHVVRLKSGDPMIFGRAGEEIEELQAAGVPVEVVPGVSTANALAASIGVSLTHRDHAQSVRFVTGHARTGELPADLDWRGLADGRTSLVFYMGGRTGPRIAIAPHRGRACALHPRARRMVGVPARTGPSHDDAGRSCGGGYGRAARATDHRVHRRGVRAGDDRQRAPAGRRKRLTGRADCP